MARKAKNLGNYGKLSPEVKNLAYGMNQEYSLGQDLAETNARVVEQRASDRDQLSSDLRALKESGVSGQELLESYGDIILINSDAKRVQHFEEMLLLGARLVPREFVRVNGEVMTIATPDDDTEEFAPTPLLLEVGAYNRGLIYEFTWAVPVVGQEEMVQVDARTTVGKEAIKKELDDPYRRGLSQLGYLRLSDEYKAIGESASAETYRRKAISLALERLRGIHGHASTTEIEDDFEVLDITGTLGQFLEELSVQIANDRTSNIDNTTDRLSLIRGYLAYRKVKRGECDNVWHAVVEKDELSGLWLALEARGKALLDLQSDQDG